MPRKKPQANWPGLQEKGKAASPHPEVRPPAVDGIFYPQEKRPLIDLIDRLVARETRMQERVVAVVVPHGAYLASGKVAGSVFSRIAPFPAAVIVGPNHARMGKPFSLCSKGEWETPLGSLPVNEELARTILAQVPEMEEDPASHRDEHAVEVQLPFLKRLKKVTSFVPVAVASGDVRLLRQMAQGLARAVTEGGSWPLLIATTHLTSYESRESVQEKDAVLLQQIVALDGEGLLKTTEETSSSMCAAAATALVLFTAKALGASQGRVAAYQAGEDQPRSQFPVVGYPGIFLQ